MTAYTIANPYPLTPSGVINATTNGYKWYFSGEPQVLNWSVSSSKWTHPILQSLETQEDFKLAFSFIAEFVDLRFNFLGYVNATGTKPGHAAAYDLGSNLNITYSYNGLTSGGAYVADNGFNSTFQTAYCYFPDSDYSSVYTGAAGDTWLNYNNPFIQSLTFEPGTNGFALLLHEVLHGLGLKHPHDDGGTGRPTYTSLGLQYMDRQWISVMSYDRLESGGDGAYTGSMPIGPMIFDAIALQYLYGESSFNASDTTYDLTRYVGNYYNCQWDAAGSDTLDGSNLSFGIVTDLGYTTESNGYNTHFVGFITTAFDYLNLEHANPQRWTWLWGEYENATGSAFEDVLLGNSYSNVLNGGGGNDYLMGREGNDTFDWDPARRGGNDTLEGGAGDDVYVLDSTGDVIIEQAFEGVDTVYAGFSYSLVGTSLENLGALGGLTSSVTFTGNSWGNLIDGGGGADTLRGNEGDDYLRGGGGRDTIDGGVGHDTIGFSGRLQDYSVTKTTTGYVTRDTVLSRDGTDAITGSERLEFSNLSVNLTIQRAAELLPLAQLDRVIELYVAFFNRVPDADGLEYWIGQVRTGVSISSIAESFYSAGVHFSSLTGFSATMDNASFVNLIYRNVLGRTDGADAGGLAYWTAKLASGEAGRGTLVSTILDSAHTFKGNLTYGWVADLLDNKIHVANTLAIDWGLNYNTSEAAISSGMAIAAAVTPTDTATAIGLVGIAEGMLVLG